MLFLNVSEKVMADWGRTIDLYYSVHLGGFIGEIKSVNLAIAVIQSEQQTETYCCEVDVIPELGEKLSLTVEQESLPAALEQSFARAKRMMLRRIRGFAETSSRYQVDYG